MNVLQEVVSLTTYLQRLSFVKRFQLVGSCVYHPDPKDIDMLVFVDSADIVEAKGAFNTLYGNGEAYIHWDLPTGEYDDQDGHWGALRAGNWNLIVTVKEDWYERARLANEVCHALKLMDKGDRIVVYRVVRDGQTAEEANKKRDGSS